MVIRKISVVGMSNYFYVSCSPQLKVDVHDSYTPKRITDSCKVRYGFQFLVWINSCCKTLRCKMGAYLIGGWRKLQG